MLTATMPFDASSIEEMVMEQTSRRIYFLVCSLTSVSESAKKLILNILEPHVILRAIIQQVKQSLWLQEVEHPNILWLPN
jgi:hypothetical protein